MSAILFLLVVLFWGAVASVLVLKLVKRVPLAIGWRVALWFVIAPLLFVAPMADEIAGARQFEALCRPENAIKVHFKVAHPRDLREVFQQQDAVPGRLIPISLQQVDYLDRKTGTIAASIKVYRTEGGWFSRKILHGWGPWFGRGACAARPEQIRQLLTTSGTV
ncbi:MAG: hypothetical protein V4679_03840 [Pseudomonadota bacterium]